jgi:hypothetical protein
MSVSWSDVICFVRGYGQSNIYWSGDYIADMDKQGKKVDINYWLKLIWFITRVFYVL